MPVKQKKKGESEKVKEKKSGTESMCDNRSQEGEEKKDRTYRAGGMDPESETSA